MIDNSILSKSRVAILVGSLMLGSYGLAIAGDSDIVLSGDQEVPAVTTSAKGEGTISITDDMDVSGHVTTTGIDSTAAHIHEAEAGKNGPPIIHLKKKGEDEWHVPDDAKLTKDQYQSYQDGNLYVNIHSDAHKGGEIRGQLKP